MNERDEATRAETVGSLLRGEAVVRAARRGGPADAAVLDDAALDAIKLQEEAGLDVITDGEVRRTGWAQTPRFARRVRGHRRPRRAELARRDAGPGERRPGRRPGRAGRPAHRTQARLPRRHAVARIATARAAPAT